MTHRISPALIAFTVLVYLFLLGPLVIVIGAALSDTTFLTFPPQGLSLRWFEKIFEMSAFRRTIVTSLQLAFASTLLALLVGIPAAYALNRYRIALPGWLSTLFVLPVLVPEIVLGFSLLRSIQVGAWRRAEVDPMQVVSGRIGRERVHFEAPAAPRVASEMRTFLTWFESATAAALAIHVSRSSGALEPAMRRRRQTTSSSSSALEGGKSRSTNCVVPRSLTSVESAGLRAYFSNAVTALATSRAFCFANFSASTLRGLLVDALGAF